MQFLTIEVCVISAYKTTLSLFLQGLPDVYTRVSSFLQWIKNTILSNGGGISCSFSFIDSPRLGNTKSDLCYMCATLVQKQKKEPENTTAFSSTFSEVNFPIQLKWTVAIIMLKAVLLVLRWYLSSNWLKWTIWLRWKIMVMEIIIYVTGEWRCLVPGRLHLVQWQLWTKWCLLFLCFFINTSSVCKIFIRVCP